MRTRNLALATALAAVALTAAAQPRGEANGPFTYEALGATPSLTFFRKAAPKAAEAPKPVTGVAAPARSASSTFTYDVLGATPHVEAKKQRTPELVTRQPAR